MLLKKVQARIEAVLSQSIAPPQCEAELKAAFSALSEEPDLEAFQSELVTVELRQQEQVTLDAQALVLGINQTVSSKNTKREEAPGEYIKQLERELEEMQRAARERLSALGKARADHTRDLTLWEHEKLGMELERKVKLEEARRLENKHKEETRRLYDKLERERHLNSTLEQELRMLKSARQGPQTQALEASAAKSHTEKSFSAQSSRKVIQQGAQSPPTHPAAPDSAVWTASAELQVAACHACVCFANPARCACAAHARAHTH
jgi:hypothetical protein